MRCSLYFNYRKQESENFSAKKTFSRPKKFENLKKKTNICKIERNRVEVGVDIHTHTLYLH
jgi:hypothetical protein